MSTSVIPNYLAEITKKYGSNQAVIMQGAFYATTYTYQELYEYSQRIATWLQQNGVQRGDNIMIWGQNSPDWVAVLFACLLSGVVLVPIDMHSTSDFVLKVADVVEAKLVVTASIMPAAQVTQVLLHDLPIITKNAERAAGVVLEPEDVVEIVFTSGTTSEPKGVVLTYGNIMANVDSLRQVMPIEPNETFLSFLPLSHMLEQTLGLFSPLYAGGKIVYVHSRRSSLLQQVVRKYKVSYIVGVPFVYESLQNKIERTLQKKHAQWLTSPWLPRAIRKQALGPFKYVKFGIVGGAPLPETTEKFWHTMGVPLLQGYGMTEASPVISCNTFTAYKMQTLGQPLPGQDIKIASNGELLVKGVNVTRGYYNNPTETANLFTEDKYLKTGDIGSIDEDNFICLKGRVKNIIITSSGLNIYPEDIEAAAMQLPIIQDVCVVELPAKDGHIIAAIVRTHSAVNEKDLQQQINAQLALAQHVQQVVQWPQKDFPRTPSGKIKRRDVLQILQNTTQHTTSSAVQDPLYSLLQTVSPLPVQHWHDSLLLQQDLGIDSLSRLELVGLLEEQYGVLLPESCIDNTTSIAALKTLLKQTKVVRSNVPMPYMLRSAVAAHVRTVVQFVAYAWLTKKVRVTVSGTEALRTLQQPCIFIMNHASHLDSLVLSYALRRERTIAFAAAEDYFFKKGILATIKALLLQCIVCVFPFARTGDLEPSLKRFGALLEHGYSVAIFPEGTRTTTGAMNAFQPGIGFITSHIQVPIVPVYANGLFSILPKGAKKVTNGNVHLTFGAPIYIPASASVAERTTTLHATLSALES